MKNRPKRIFVIAEAGVNHNGDIRTAMRMVDAAKKAGADAVKFQTFSAEEIATKRAFKADYQKKSVKGGDSQVEMLKDLELDERAHKILIRHCLRKRIMFLSSPFDLKSIDLLSRLGVELFKIPSGEITNVPYLRKIAGLKKDVILSTGMADLKEVRYALKVLADSGVPKERVILLHCHSEYPTSFKDANLSAISQMRDIFKVRVGYSDHTLGIVAPIVAAALGAVVIEKHLTLDRSMSGPDHRASLEPGEFRKMVEAVRVAEIALGNGRKKPSIAELGNIIAVRKGIVALRDIKKGEKLSENNLTTKRPCVGINAVEWDRVVGRIAKNNFKANDPIRL